MPVFEFTSPEGKKYEITGPEGATQAQAFQILQQQLKGGGETPVPGAPSQPKAPMGLGEVATSAVRNLPKSAAKFATDLVEPLIHPVETATNLRNVAAGGLQKLGLDPQTVGKYAGMTGPLGAPLAAIGRTATKGEDYTQYPEALAQFFKDRYGGVENIKRTLAEDPVGAAADASMLLTGGGSAASRAPGLLGKAGQAVATAGRAIDPIVGTGKLLKGAGHVGGEIIGSIGTHTGGEALKTAARAGAEGGEAARMFQSHLRGGAEMEDVVKMAGDAVKQMRKERGAEYRTKMAALGLDKTVLDFQKIGQALLDAERVQTYKGQSLSKSTEKIRQEMIGAVIEWSRLNPKEFHTIEGMDALKRKLGDMREATQYGTPERVAADKIYNSVRQTIVDQAPQYAKTMKGYEEASKIVRQLEKTLSLKPDATVDTALRKLQSVLRNNVNTSYGFRKKLAEFLVNSGAPHLMEALAGQALSPWAARGLGRLGAQIGAEMLAVTAGAHLAGTAGVGVLATAAAMSPRLMGETAYYLGKGSRIGEPAGRTLYQTGRFSRDQKPKYGGPVE